MEDREVAPFQEVVALAAVEAQLVVASVAACPEVARLEEVEALEATALAALRRRVQPAVEASEGQL